MKEKIAVCIPSFNESHIIAQTLKKVDIGLKKYLKSNYDVVIVNVDNNSPDGTATIFMNVDTFCPKISIITNESGKGTNLLKFFEYCYENHIDYAVTIDADVKSMQPIWIKRFLDPLIENGCDYVTPLYKRSRYEGSTTNHFAFPLIYATTGIPIRQPIAGDFSFNKKFIELIVKQPVNDSIKKYGIDIFMTLTACCNFLNISQISLGKKIHNPSYGKMEGMFQEVLDAFLFTWNNFYQNWRYFSNRAKIDFNFKTSIISSRKFEHKKIAKEKLLMYSSKVKVKDDIEQAWINKLKEVVLNPELIDEKEKKQIFYFFMVRATDFWIKAENMSAEICEDKILIQSQKLYNCIRKEENSINEKH